MRAEATTQTQASRLVRDYGLAAAIAITVALLVRFFIIEAYRIPSPSMRPALEAGDTVFVAKWPFGLRMPGGDEPFSQGRPPRRGEVVIFSHPKDPGRDYVKRVVGLPGDAIEFRRGRLFVNGQDRTLPGTGKNELCGQESLEPGESHTVCWEPPLPEEYGPEKVPAGHAFLAGDLRSLSVQADPRKPRGWGLVPFNSLKGKALWIWLSIEPPGTSGAGWFSRIRFERMFRRIP